MGKKSKKDNGIKLDYCASNIGNAVLDVEYNLAIHSAEFKQRWRERSIKGHLWKALIHILNYFLRDKTEPHLTHAATRLLMALQLAYENNKDCEYHYNNGEESNGEA